MWKASLLVPGGRETAARVFKVPGAVRFAIQHCSITIAVPLMPSAFGFGACCWLSVQGPLPPDVASILDETELEDRVLSKIVPLYQRDLARREENRIIRHRQSTHDLSIEQLAGARKQDEKLQVLSGAAGAHPTEPRLQRAVLTARADRLTAAAHARAGAKVEEEGAALREKHRKEEEAAAIAEAASVIDAAGSPAVAAVETALRSAEENHGATVVMSAKLEALEAETGKTEDILCAQEEMLGWERVEAKRGALPEQKEGTMIHGFNGRGEFIRLVPGPAQTQEWRRQSATLPHHIASLPERTNHTLRPVVFNDSLSFTLPEEAITLGEATKAAAEFNETESDIPGAAALLRASITAISAAAKKREYDGQTYVKSLIRGRHMPDPVKRILEHAQGEIMVCAVRPGGGPGLGPEISPFWVNGNPAGGSNGTYPSTYLLGLTPESSPTMSEMESKGVTRVYLLLIGATLCEAFTEKQYIHESCVSDACIGLAFVGRGLVETRPVVLCGISGRGKLVPWKRFTVLGEKCGEMDCLVVLVLVIIISVSPRGWFRMLTGSGKGYQVTQGRGLRFTTPSRQRRAEVVGEEAELARAASAEVLAGAAKKLDVRASLRAMACGEVAARARTIGTAACALADVYYDIVVTFGAAESSEVEKARDAFYTASGIIWRAQRAVMGAMKVLQGESTG